MFLRWDSNPRHERFFSFSIHPVIGAYCAVGCVINKLIKLKLATIRDLPSNLNRSCFVATWALNIEVPFLFSIPTLAPLLTIALHNAPLPFWYANSNTVKNKNNDSNNNYYRHQPSSFDGIVEAALMKWCWVESRLDWDLCLWWWRLCSSFSSCRDLKVRQEDSRRPDAI